MTLSKYSHRNSHWNSFFYLPPPQRVSPTPSSSLRVNPWCLKKNKLIREHRNGPGTDTKTNLSWNGSPEELHLCTTNLARLNSKFEFELINIKPKIVNKRKEIQCHHLHTCQWLISQQWFAYCVKTQWVLSRMVSSLRCSGIWIQADSTVTGILAHLTGTGTGKWIWLPFGYQIFTNQLTQFGNRPATVLYHAGAYSRTG